MWFLCKSTFLEAHEGLQRNIQAFGGADQISSTNAASVEANTSRTPTGATPDILDKMDDYMDNMSNSVTNKKAVLEKLVATNAKKPSTIITQATTNLSLSYEVKKLQLSIVNKGFIGVIGGNYDNVSKWLKCGYCWSRGYKVLHKSPDFKNKNKMHKE